MPLKAQDHILIEKHLLEQLNEGERIAFDQRLGDSDFKKELDLQMDLKVAFKAEGREHLKKQLIDFEHKIPHAKEKENRSSSRFSIGRILTIAASLVFLFLAAYWIVQEIPNKNGSYAQYFEPYPNIIAPIAKGKTEDDQRSKAFQTYELKNYPEALTLLNALPVQDETTAFYKGLCELALQNPKEAISYFDQVKDTENSLYYPGLWYKALVLLKLDKMEDAKLLLERVAENGETKKLRNQAEGLLEALD